MAAILSNLRKIRRGERLLIRASEGQVRELSEALDLFSRYGLVSIVGRPSEREALVEKIK